MPATENTRLLITDEVLQKSIEYMDSIYQYDEEHESYRPKEGSCEFDSDDIQSAFLKGIEAGLTHNK